MDDKETKYNQFDEYLRQSEPHKLDKVLTWKTAIGLQAVDGLSPSNYLIETAKRHIDGDISIEEVQSLLDSYYKSKSSRTIDEEKMEEADKVSANIARILNEKTFSFSPTAYINIHKCIFDGVFKFAGKVRDYNITKNEWVLRGDTVYYASADDIMPALEYDFSQEKEFNYAGLSKDRMVKHFAKFVANIWQIHAFGEGNTRTTAVFAIKYLSALGFSVTNTPFESHSWYFRNALVRANYRNYQRNITPTLKFLEAFFRNLLFGENNELKNRYLIIEPPKELASEIQETSIEPVYRTSTEQVPNKLGVDNPNIIRVLQVLKNDALSIKEILSLLGLKHRPTFLENYLKPAIQGGFVVSLYLDKPNHPRQKYLLTEKGLILYRRLGNRE
jgi:fido (protein-threonine AMPylation protein)